MILAISRIPYLHGLFTTLIRTTLRQGILFGHLIWELLDAVEYIIRTSYVYHTRYPHQTMNIPHNSAHTSYPIPIPHTSAQLYELLTNCFLLFVTFY